MNCIGLFIETREQQYVIKESHFLCAKIIPM